MQQTIGLGLATVAFSIGVLLGAVDSRTTQGAVPSAHAESKGGPGDNTGCDGRGTAPSCSACNGGDCVAVCIGDFHCEVTPHHTCYANTWDPGCISLSGGGTTRKMD